MTTSNCVYNASTIKSGTASVIFSKQKEHFDNCLLYKLNLKLFLSVQQHVTKVGSSVKLLAGKHTIRTFRHMRVIQLTSHQSNRSAILEFPANRPPKSKVSFWCI